MSSDSSSSKLLQHAHLERNIPGVIVVLQLHAQYITECHRAGEVAEICHAKLVQQLIQKTCIAINVQDEMGIKNETTETEAIPALESSSSSSAETSTPASALVSSVLHKISKDAHVNRFNKVVDELERKYYSYSQMVNFEEDSSSQNKDSVEDDHAKEDIDENIENDPNNYDAIHKAGELEQKRRKNMRQSFNHCDDYDMDDPFIDDSEMVQEFEIDLRMKKARTKQGGFFVSSGKLELAKRKTQSPLRVLKLVKKHRVRFKEPSKSTTKNTVNDDHDVTAAAPSSPVENSSSSDSAKRQELEHVANISSPSYFADLVAFHKSRPICDMTGSEAAECDEIKKKRKATPGDSVPATKKAPRIKTKATGSPPPTTTSLFTSADQTAVGSGEALSDSSRNDTFEAAEVNDVLPAINVVEVASSALLNALPPGGGEDAVGSPDNAVVKERKKRVNTAKPLWEPSTEIIEALSYFKSFFDRGGYTLLKSSFIPKALEEPLHALDIFVTQRYNNMPLPSTLNIDESAVDGGDHPPADTGDRIAKRNRSATSIRCRNIDKTSGFHEAIHEILGGKINIGRIRYTMQKLRLRDEAAALKKDLDALVSAFCVTLKAKVAACPLSMQPTLKVKPNKENTTTTTRRSDNNAITSSSNQLKNVDGGVNDGAEASADGFGDSSTAMVLDTHREVESPQPQHKEVQTAKVVTKKSEKTVVITYDFHCKWDIPLRAALVDIEESIDRWIKAENHYREKLTISDKKYMAENEVTPLTLESFLTEYLSKIGTVFPPKCLRGDVESLRGAIMIEKRRLAKPLIPSTAGDKKPNDTDNTANKSGEEGKKVKRATPQVIRKQSVKKDEVIQVVEEDEYTSIQLLPEILI